LRIARPVERNDQRAVTRLSPSRAPVSDAPFRIFGLFQPPQARDGLASERDRFATRLWPHLADFGHSARPFREVCLHPGYEPWPGQNDTWIAGVELLPTGCGALSLGRSGIGTTAGNILSQRSI